MQPNARVARALPAQKADYVHYVCRENIRMCWDILRVHYVGQELTVWWQDKMTVTSALLVNIPQWWVPRQLMYAHCAWRASTQ